ncbi:hypothetical protein [Psychrobacter sp. 72-O-c]|uniref:hypothetical protein n=1 Tax=Psychrobacter sp. 72-O-c TaxID=2774125 RepID=UPI001919733A|nr:hypothetical protein [Psychrobacter sp. 72-O-c]
MRVSFELTSNQDIQKIVAERIQLIEFNFLMEIKSFSIKQMNSSDFGCDFESLSSEEVKQALSGWECEQSFEVRLEFKGGR